ncbi:MAG: cytochrome d ubiquinol oxidase subunit II [Thermoleophilaceae bacterium]
MAEAPLILMLVGLAAYTILGGADFGAGFWELLARGRRNAELRDHTHRALAPVWEANHVWLIFVLVMCWTAYPEAFASIVTTLTIPFFLAGVGIILRGASYALRSGVDSPHEEGGLSLVFALSSIVAPFALGTMVGAIAAGEVPVGNAVGEPVDSWVNPTALTIGVLAVATSAYVAAVYLAGDARRMGATEMAEAFRRRALVAGVVAGGIALGALLVVRAEVRPLFDDLTGGAGLAAVLASAVAGVATLALVAARRFEPARYSAGAAVAAIIAGWGIAQQPRFLPGLTIEEAAASDATIVAVLIGFAVGLLLLVPSLAYLFRLVLTGRFDPAAPLRPSEHEGPPAAAERARGRPLPYPSATVAAAVTAVGAAVTFAFDDLIRGAGVAAMLAGAVALFMALGTLDEP